MNDYYCKRDKFHFPFKSCEFPPMKLPEHLKETNVIFTFVPDPLHINLLGTGNYACDCLEKNFPVEMSEFYEKNHLKKSGQGPGGKFNGPSFKFIIQEDSISQPEELLPIFKLYEVYQRIALFVHSKRIG